MSYKLPCGCIPDASGYGYCPECERKLKAKIWKQMSEEKKRYDRYVDPEGSSYLDNITDAEYNTSCSCHINPPCGYCTNKNEENEE